MGPEFEQLEPRTLFNAILESSPIFYDDFSASTLNSEKWDVKSDVEGQPMMDVFGLDTSLQNFHMQQNFIGDRRTYLVPKHSFTTGDVIEYDFNVISKEGNYMQMDLLTGDQYIRLGIMGYVSGVQGYDEFGTSHVRVEFQEGNLALRRESPSGLVLFDNLSLTNQNGDSTLYIGAGSGHNGKTHMDFDDFYLSTQRDDIPEPAMGLMLLAGGVGLAGYAVKRRKREKFK